MATIGRIAVDFTVVTKGVASSLQSVTGQIARAGKKITSLGGRISGGFLRGAAAIGKFAAAGTALAGGAAAGFLGWGVKLAAEAEQAEVAFTTLLGSADIAKKVLSDISSFAAETPFQISELRDAGRNLAAFGFSAESIVPTLRRIGDLAAGVGQPIGELAEIFGKAKVQGRLFMEDINQLTGRGIPIIAELAKQFDVAESEVRQLVESGRVNFGNLQQALVSLTSEGGKFHGLMAAQSQTLSGKWSTLKDNIAALARDMAAGLLPVAKSIIDVLLPMAPVISESLARSAPLIKRFTQGLMDGFIGVAATIRATFAAGRVIMSRFGEFVYGIGQNIFATFKATWSAVVAGAISLYNNAGNVFKDLGAIVISFAKATWQALKAAFSLENPIKAFRDTFAKEFVALEAGGLAQVGEDMAKAFAETYRANASQAVGEITQQAKDAFTKTFAESVNAFDRKAKDVDLKPIAGPQIRPEDVKLPDQDQKRAEKIKQSLKAVTRGSAEAINAIAAAFSGKPKDDVAQKQLRVLHEQLAATREQNTLLRKRLDFQTV